MFDENGNGAMAMVNHLMNVKDSRWLQVEVCREFQRGQCSREFNECKFAHPPAHVEVQNGRVTACYDSIKKGKCNRENPKCKYLHPPQHIKDQLLINGRNNLALKNLIMNQLTNGYQPTAAAAAIPGQAAAFSQAAALQQHPAFLAHQLASVGQAGSLGGLGSLGGYPGYYAAISPGALYSPAQPSAIPASSASSDTAPNHQQQPSDLSVTLGSLAGSPLAHQPKPRTDRVEVCREFLRGSCGRAEGECKFAHPGPEVERGTDGSVRVCLDFVRAGGAGGACAGLCRLFHPPPHLLLALYTASLAANAGTAAFPDPPLSPTAASFASALAAHANSSAATMVTSSVQSQPTARLSPASGIGKKRRLDETEPVAVSAVSAVNPAAAFLNHPQLQLQHQLLLLQHQQQQQQQQQQAAGVAGVGSIAGVAGPNPDAPTSSIAAQSTNPLLLAALQQQQQAVMAAQAQKRLAVEAKSGLPVYQPQAPTNPAAAAAAAAALHHQVSAGSGMGGAGLAGYYQAAAAAAQPHQFFAAAPANPGYIPTLALGGGGGGGGGLAVPALPPNANNTASVAYFDESGQLLDTLPVCRDFKQAHCERPSCRYVHLLEDYVEVHEGKVTVCRDYAKGKCSRVMCKYYHVPILHPGASPLLLQPSALTGTGAAQSVSLLQPSLLTAAAAAAPTSLFQTPTSLFQSPSSLLNPAGSQPACLFSVGPLQSA